MGNSLKKGCHLCLVTSYGERMLIPTFLLKVIHFRHPKMTLHFEIWGRVWEISWKSVRAECLQLVTVITHQSLHTTPILGTSPSGATAYWGPVHSVGTAAPSSHPWWEWKTDGFLHGFLTSAFPALPLPAPRWAHAMSVVTGATACPGHQAPDTHNCRSHI